MEPVRVSLQTARRFVLGNQGIWPGRRWSGRAGAAEAIRTGQSVQIDPIQILHRCHDLALHARVEGYRPEHLDSLVYKERRFFDYGGILTIYPWDDLPLFRAVMEDREKRWVGSERVRRDVMEWVLAEIRERGPLANRDFADRPRISGGWGTLKDTWAAIYTHWYHGRLMTHSRRRNDRLYDLSERVLNDSLPGAIGQNDVLECFVRKALADYCLATASEIQRRTKVYQDRKQTPGMVRQILDHLVQLGEAIPVQVEGMEGPLFARAESEPLLAELERGETPRDWVASRSSTDREAVFIAPLDSVVWDRRRTQALFGFEYAWEVYKPAPQRRWGYYTLPVLWGDELVARMDARLDRKRKALVITGFWLETNQKGSQTGFRRALSSGLSRFAAFHEAVSVEVSDDALGDGTHLARKAAP